MATMLKYSPFFVALFFAVPSALAQHETRGQDPYLPQLKEQRQTSPAYRFSKNNFTVVQVNVDENGNNILNDAANEPSIAVSPVDPNRMVIGWRQFDNIGSSFRQAGFGYTTDGGQTWTFPGSIEPGIFRSDPVLAADAAGRFYYNSLAVNPEFKCDVFRSTGDGTWDSGTFAQGGDKQWMVIDKTAGAGAGNIYAFWSESYSVCEPGSFTRSANAGDSYEDCDSPEPDVFWGSLDVGPDGELYLLGVTGNLAKSENAQNAAESIVWQPKFVDLGGPSGAFGAESPNPQGLLGQAWVAVNHAPGDLRGEVYTLISGQPTDGSGDPLDVFFNRSSDGGDTWAEPVRINDDAEPAAWQWFGTMSVAPNGRIDAVWLDTRDHPGTYRSSLYYANSFDGGLTWSPNERLSEAFDPHIGWPVQQKMGDYFHMVSDNFGAHLAWAGTFTGGQDVYYGHISVAESAVSNVGDAALGQLFQNQPNPARGQTSIPFQLAENGRVQVKIFNQTGQLLRTLADENRTAGRHTLAWDGKDAQGRAVPTGVYFYELNFEGKSLGYRRMVVAE
jgi:hypothetical protein